MTERSEGIINKKYGKMFKEHLLEQYKLYVETAERVTEKRQTANTFFMTITASIFAISSYFASTLGTLLTIVMPIVGVFVSLIWFKSVKSFRQLNSGKYKVIHELEEHLPASLFAVEWEYLERGEGKKYNKLTVIESYIPVIFILLYLLFICLYLIGVYGSWTVN